MPPPRLRSSRVRARACSRRSRSDAAELTRSFAALLAPLLEVTAADLTRGLELFEVGGALGPFDAVLVSAAANAGARAVASADRSFVEQDAVPVFDPAVPGSRDALGL